MESIATPDNAHGKETYCHCENESIGRYVGSGSSSTVRPIGLTARSQGSSRPKAAKADAGLGRVRDRGSNGRRLRIAGLVAPSQEQSFGLSQYHAWIC